MLFCPRLEARERITRRKLRATPKFFDKDLEGPFTVPSFPAPTWEGRSALLSMHQPTKKRSKYSDVFLVRCCPRRLLDEFEVPRLDRMASKSVLRQIHVIREQLAAIALTTRELAPHWDLL